LKLQILDSWFHRIWNKLLTGRLVLVSFRPTGYWIGSGLDLDLGFRRYWYQSTSGTNVYGLIRLYNCTIARFTAYGIYCAGRILS
jgi:hypothetical protein